MRLLGILAVLAIPCVVLAAPYAGATLKVYDIASSDVPGPEPIRKFPVPAAAGWASSVCIYDNWAEGLTFSTTEALSGFQYYGLPLSNSEVTVNGVNNPPPPTLSNTYSFYTNVEGSDSDPEADNRFPYHIPRLARAQDANYFSVEFDLATPVSKLGVFLPASSNTWGEDPSKWFPHNFQLQDRSVYVYIMSETDTVGSAQVVYQSLTVSGSAAYCPFLEITWNGTDLIKRVAIVHDVNEGTDKGVGFMDIYVLPEPATMTLLLASAATLILRKRRR